jgi:hypothetical protein
VVAQHIVRREGGTRVLGRSCSRSYGEDGGEDLPVHFGAAAARRCGVGGQVAAVVGAEVVAARGGCLRRRDRRRHLRSDLRLFGFDGLSSPIVWGCGRGSFHSSVCPEVIAAAVQPPEAEVVVAAGGAVAGEPPGVCYPTGLPVWRLFISAGVEPESRL